MSDLITHATIWKNRLMWNSPNSTVIYWMYLQLWVPENLTPPAFNAMGWGNQYLELSRVFILPRDTKLTPKFKLILNSLQKHTHSLTLPLTYTRTHTTKHAVLFRTYVRWPSRVRIRASSSRLFPFAQCTAICRFVLFCWEKNCGDNCVFAISDPTHMGTHTIGDSIITAQTCLRLRLLVCNSCQNFLFVPCPCTLSAISSSKFNFGSRFMWRLSICDAFCTYQALRWILSETVNVRVNYFSINLKVIYIPIGKYLIMIATGGNI